MTSKRISATEFLNSFSNLQSTQATVLDLRTPGEVAREHIDNCAFLPLQQLTRESLSNILPDNTSTQRHKVYLLCQSGMRADVAVRQMGDLDGVEWVVIEGGLNAIKAAGGDTRKGERKTLPIERQVRIAAGLVILTGIALGFTLNPALFVLSGAVGAGLVFAGITDRCGLAFVLTRMPWNQ